MRGRQAERIEFAREFLATVPDDQLLSATVWGVMYCWLISCEREAENLLLAERLKRGLITLDHLRPDQRREFVDLDNLDLKALAAGPIMDPARLYLPAGKISLSDAISRERAAVQKL